MIGGGQLPHPTSWPRRSDRRVESQLLGHLRSTNVTAPAEHDGVAPLGRSHCWAIESAAGLGHLLSQQLVAVGERVVDGPARLSSRGATPWSPLPVRQSLSPIYAPTRSRRSACTSSVTVRREGRPSSPVGLLSPSGDLQARALRRRSRVDAAPVPRCARRGSRASCRVRRRGSPGADPPRTRRCSLAARLSAPCQHDSRPPTQTSVRYPSGAVSYNRRTTRRAPTGSHQRPRQRCSSASNRQVMRENADERRPAPTASVRS